MADWSALIAQAEATVASNNQRYRSESAPIPRALRFATRSATPGPVTGGPGGEPEGPGSPSDPALLLNGTPVTPGDDTMEEEEEEDGGGTGG